MTIGTALLAAHKYLKVQVLYLKLLPKKDDLFPFSQRLDAFFQNKSSEAFILGTPRMVLSKGSRLKTEQWRGRDSDSLQ